MQLVAKAWATFYNDYVWGVSIFQIELNSLVAQVQDLAEPEATGAGKLTFGRFLPKEVKNLEFFSYMGSLTTPNCDQIVKWTVFSDIKPISNKQVCAYWVWA